MSSSSSSSSSSRQVPLLVPLLAAQESNGRPPSSLSPLLPAPRQSQIFKCSCVCHKPFPVFSYNEHYRYYSPEMECTCNCASKAGGGEEGNKTTHKDSVPSHVTKKHSDGMTHKRHKDTFSFRSLDYTHDGVSIHGILSPPTTPSPSRLRSSLPPASSPLSPAPSPRCSQRTTHRTGSSQSPRSAQKRELTVSPNDVVLQAPAPKKERDESEPNDNSGLGVTMKIRFQDTLLYFPALISSSSCVVPLRVRPFSEVSKLFVPLISKEDFQSTLKRYGKN